MAPNDDEEELLHSVAMRNAKSILLAQKNAEDALRKQSEWLRTTLASIGDAVISTDTDGRVTFLNGVAERLVGWTQNEATGQPMDRIFRIINEDTRLPAEDPIAQVLRQGISVGLDHHTILIAKDGTETPIDDSAAPIRDAEGRVVGVVVVFRDVAERRRQETVIEEHRQLAEFGRDIGLAFTEVDSLAEMIDRCCELTVRDLRVAFARIWTLVPGGDILELRSSAGCYTHINGTHARVPVGQLKIGVIASERKPHLTNSVIGDPGIPAQDWAKQQGMVAFAGYPLVVEDRLVGVWAMFAHRKLSGDAFRGMEAIAKQIALGIERKMAEEAMKEAKREAEEANNAKTQFLAVLSHELRTPLNPILLAVTAMLERPEEPAQLRSTLEMIRQNVNLQARLIDDLLDVMRIVRGKMPLHWEVADSHILIRQAIQICQSELFGKELHVETELRAEGHHLNADSARFQQVIWNLLRNAIKFTPNGGKITIRTSNEDGLGGERLVIEVSDTGIGIDPLILPRIFDPFQQGESKITRKFGGLGLGLAICRGIVEAHGGILEAESEGKDRGTTLRISMKTIPSPTATNDRPISNTTEAKPTAELSLKLLIVEDEPATSRLMARLLEVLGHEVTTAGTVADALEATEAAEFDLIVSDIGLPDGSGLDLMKRVVARRGRVPAIALTGYGMEDDIKRSQEAGFTTHLTKPIDFAKLATMIRQLAT
jgi:PAS domain S-box-containing protein